MGKATVQLPDHLLARDSIAPAMTETLSVSMLDKTGPTARFLNNSLFHLLIDRRRLTMWIRPHGNFKSSDDEIETPVSQQSNNYWTGHARSSKSFLLLASRFIGQDTGTWHLRFLSCSEAECIVFAVEGLLLAHGTRSTAESWLNAVMKLNSYRIDTRVRFSVRSLQCSRP